MIYFVALIAGLLGGLTLGFCVGFGAAELFTRLGGSREGANAMGGFFFIGPFGLVSGFLMAFGATLRYGGGSTVIAKWTLIGGGGVLGLGALLVLFLVASQADARGPSSDFVLDFEIELPPGVPPEEVGWIYASADGGAAKADWPFHADGATAGGAATMRSAMQLSDSWATHRHIRLARRGAAWQDLDIPLHGYVSQTVEWTQWTEGKDHVRYRWCVVGRR